MNLVALDTWPSVCFENFVSSTIVGVSYPDSDDNLRVTRVLFRFVLPDRYQDPGNLYFGVSGYHERGIFPAAA